MTQQLISKDEMEKSTQAIIENERAKFDPKKLMSWADADNLFTNISWIWRGWIAKGFLIFLVGGCGDGKSNLLLRICQIYINGDSFPDGTPFTFSKTGILWIETEAAEQLNWQRATDWGIPKDKIYYPLKSPLDSVMLDNPEHRLIIEKKAALPEIGLIIVDSFSNSHSRKENSEDAGEISKWLAELARNTQKELIVSHHLNKPGKDFKGEITLDRVRGHGRIIQPARIIWAVDVPDLTIKNQKRLKVIKSNLGKFPDPIGFEINDSGITFGDAPTAPKNETQTDKAIDLLQALLRVEPMSASALQKEADRAVISWKTFCRAKEKIGIVSIKQKDGWKWSLPYSNKDNY